MQFSSVPEGADTGTPTDWHAAPGFARSRGRGPRHGGGDGRRPRKAVVEQALADSGLSYTIAGTTYFYDNILGGLDEIRAGVFELALPADVELQQLSRRDLGRFVASILADPKQFRGVRIDIASDSPTPQDMATALGDALGRPMKLVTHDPSEIASPEMRAMFGFLASGGYTVNLPDLHTRYPQISWQSFADWVGTDLVGVL